MPVALILQAIGIGADIFVKAMQAYEQNKDAFTSEDQEVVRAAIAQVAAINNVKEEAALTVLRRAREN